ncbi:MAG: fasciclin domain-containing protein [Armatimonadaceae bacterium]
MKMFAAAAALAVVALASRTASAADTIVGIAAGNKDFSTLVTAVKAAGLVEVLSGKGPFTVFAPTNAAFAKIPKEKLDAILKDKKLLTAILTYHVVPGKVMAADVVKLKDGTKVKTVQGASITVGLKGGVTVDKAKVVKTDIEASNGVIHVIDTVILPPTK